MAHERQPRRSKLRYNAKRGHEEVKRMLTHMFKLLWKRYERNKERMKTMTEATDRLTKEVAETREAVMAKLAKMQEQIDILLANPADEQAVIDAANKLNDLQTEITGVVEPDPNA